MPHRPEGQGTAGVVNSSVYTPPRVAGSAAAAIMRHQTSDNTISNIAGQTAAANLQYGAHAGIVTPVIKSKSGLTWLAAGYSNKSSDSTDRSTATTEDSRSIATLATEDEREATASALLMVAKAAEREQNYLKGMVVGSLPSVTSSSSTVSASTVPLKKRKKQLQKDACHVSPVSHSSESANASASTNRANSYDSKDMGSSVVTTPKAQTTQELLDSAKVHSTTQIGAGATLSMSEVLVPHFPTVLHQVLSDKDVTNDDQGSAIQWTSDGEAWKVNNWNAMRRQVLPKYFSGLRDENGSACGTIDAFLYHIDAWGFQEIKNGPNAGAYHHNLFIRGAQKLCVKMRFTSDSSSNGNSSKVTKTVSPGHNDSGETERMMLQVPMLASAGGDLQNQASLPPNKRPRFDSNTMGQTGHGALHWPYSNESTVGAFWGSQFNPHAESPHARAYGMRAALNAYSSPNGTFGVDPRMQLSRVPTSDSMNMPRQQQSFVYSPPQVRSGRGALRGIAPVTQQQRGSATSSPCNTPSFRHGFPVSNRGKSRRKSTPCRPTPANSGEANQEASPSTPMASAQHQEATSSVVSLSEAQRIGSSVQGVAVAISRKTKRKLPLAATARKASESKADTAATKVSGADDATTSVSKTSEEQ